MNVVPFIFKLLNIRCPP